jgi:hypothetical protein
VNIDRDNFMTLPNTVGNPTMRRHRERPQAIAA